MEKSYQAYFKLKGKVSARIKLNHIKSSLIPGFQKWLLWFSLEGCRGCGDPAPGLGSSCYRGRRTSLNIWGTLVPLLDCRRCRSCRRSVRAGCWWKGSPCDRSFSCWNRRRPLIDLRFDDLLCNVCTWAITSLLQKVISKSNESQMKWIQFCPPLFFTKVKDITLVTFKSKWVLHVHS